MILIQTIYTTKMPFEKGNKLGKGRPAGSKNKSTDVDKMDLQEMLFNIEDMKRDFLTLDAYKKFDVRMKAMSFFYSKPSIEMTVESKPWKDIGFITDVGEEDLPEEEKKRIYFKHGGDGINPIDLPLFLDE